MKRRVLIAEDSAATRDQLRRLLEAAGGYEVEGVGDGSEALERLRAGRHHLLLTDLRMPGLDGIGLVKAVQSEKLPVTIVVMTGHASVDQAVLAIRSGAYDFLPKPVDFDHLKLVLERAANDRKVQDEIVRLREELDGRHAFQNVISKSPRMHAIFELIQDVAPLTTTVLIEGETGTGKEQLAKALHQASATLRSGPLVAVNCAALPEHLLESELFGHEKGAFTGADRQRSGRFERAQGGTLFLDEVGEVPQGMQVKLLRVLQERRVERLGATDSIALDVRVVAATNKPLARLVRKGEFREDLFYRLNVVRIEVPPLRERPEDVPLLAVHFAKRHARPDGPPKGITPGAMELLVRSPWPGNVRQLENAIERACVTARGDAIDVEDLPADLTGTKTGALERPIDLSRPLPALIEETVADLEKRYLRRALRKTEGHVGRAALIAGLSRRSVTTKLSDHGIDRDEYRKGKSGTNDAGGTPGARAPGVEE